MSNMFSSFHRRRRRLLAQAVRVNLAALRVGFASSTRLHRCQPMHTGCLLRLELSAQPSILHLARIPGLIGPTPFLLKFAHS